METRHLLVPFWDTYWYHFGVLSGILFFDLESDLQC